MARFKKGQSGNPKGRPKKNAELEQYVRAMLIGDGGENRAAEGLLQEALNAQEASVRVRAWELLLAHGWGKPRQRVEHSGPDGGAIRVDPTKLSDGELAAIAAGEGTTTT